MNRIKIKEALRIGWELFKKHPGFSLGVLAILMFVAIINGAILEQLHGLIFVITYAATFIFETLIGMGVMYLFIRMYDGQDVTYGHMFEPMGRLVPYLFTQIVLMLPAFLLGGFGAFVGVIGAIFLGTGVVTGTFVIVGVSLLVLALAITLVTVLVMVMCVFAPYLALESDATGWSAGLDALKKSMNLTKGHRVEIAWFMAAMILVNILGFIALFVGLVVTVPVTMFAMVHLYRTFVPRAHE